VASARRIVDRYLAGDSRVDALDVQRVIGANIRDSKTFDEVMHCVDELERSGIKFSDTTYLRIISTCTHFERSDKVLALFEEIKRANVKPDVGIYRAVTIACVRENRPDDALHAFREMKAKNVEPDVAIYNTVIGIFEKDGRVDEALALFDEMKHADIERNVVTYNTLISACMNGKCADKALDLFGEMTKAGVPPDVVTYNALISGCINEGRHKEAEELLLDAQGKVFQSSLGYNTRTKTINFHRDAVWMDTQQGDHVPGVQAGVAIAIFRHFVSQFTPRTLLVTGQSGNNKVKDAIDKEMRAHGMKPVPHRWRNGNANLGAFVWGTPVESTAVNTGRIEPAPEPDQQAVKATLDPTAAEFKPMSATS
jgi:pentatricopeptide repeat protein